MPKKIKKIDATYVLWGQFFEDDLATFLVSHLRKLGSPVKLVGIDGPSASGIYGISLNVDISLDQALRHVEHSASIIIPCDIAGVTRMGDDPRLRQLLNNATNNNVRIIFKEDIKNKINALKWLRPYRKAIEFYTVEPANTAALHSLTTRPHPELN